MNVYAEFPSGCQILCGGSVNASGQKSSSYECGLNFEKPLCGLTKINMPVCKTKRKKQPNRKGNKTTKSGLTINQLNDAPIGV
jgi:hypothetical protein